MSDNIEELRDDEAVCSLTGYTYNKGLNECPHHYHESVTCTEGLVVSYK